ncbi:hypothetical protein EHS13_15660 [Paenibacillus psychroresistens]|uniref:Uncharacterized protein n=1 Tax=Paenibacillus psychroresistens TaxID=1778678 RepID=A0A6B8RID8_9BACL|nr:hypothetical protein [Paenibacillus psychroresistens]QGQ96211.1 hypothetical protein EHS13_15660 [Paenibacillus psychroresistens]
MNSSTIRKKSNEYLHKRVRIKAKNGNIYTGFLVRVDDNKLLLRVTAISNGKKVQTAFFPFFLPLFFFDLFFIGLLI